MLFLMIFIYNHTVQKLDHNDYYLNLIIYVKTQKLYDKIKDINKTHNNH